MPRNDEPLIQQGDGPVPLGGQPSVPIDASDVSGETANDLFRKKAEEALSTVEALFRSLPRVQANAYCAGIKSALAFTANHLESAIKGA